MAELRIPPASLPAVPRPAAAQARIDAARAAQRAFFQTATAEPPQPQSPGVVRTEPDAGPQRPLRPGSLLDIKV